MFLTRLRLDLRCADARRDLANPYDMHRTLVRAFVNDAVDTPPRILWRAEPEGAASGPVVLVQSQQRPDWSRLSAVPGYLSGPAESKEFSLEAWPTNGSRFRFRLFANAKVTRNGKRLGLVSEEAQRGWLARQGERLGFHVEAVAVVGSDLLVARKRDALINLQRTCFEGVLRTVDAESLRSAVRDGVGSGKAFGLGLLSLVRC